MRAAPQTDLAREYAAWLRERLTTAERGHTQSRPGHQSSFHWVVSDFGLIDAIESGLVKIPQLAVRDTTGAAIPGYFNIWHWILRSSEQDIGLTCSRPLQ